MYKILDKKLITEYVNQYKILARDVAKHARAGQFIILRVDENGERVPFTICDYDIEKGTVDILVQTVGYTTKKLAELNAGDSVHDFVGPLGKPTDLTPYKKVLIIGGGIGTAVIYPQAKQLKSLGKIADCIIGARNVSLLMFEDELKSITNNFYALTDDGSNGNKGFVTTKLKELLDEGESFDAVFAVGPMPMMKAVCDLTREYKIKTIVSMNTLMVDGTGMCGSCRLTVGGVEKYACVDGPEFDGHLVDFNEAMQRSKLYSEQEKEHICRLRDISYKNSTKSPRHALPEQSAQKRIHNFDEVTSGFDFLTARAEAERCLNCKAAPCRTGCPVGVNIPSFIKALRDGELEKAADIVKADNNLPAICGRVCPQENQCEKYCVRNKMGGAVAIGALERFVGDYSIFFSKSKIIPKPKNGKRVAIVGSGPSSLSCAASLIAEGFDVTMFEAFHKAGGVLVYGIPEFRLPKSLVQAEIDKIVDAGVKIVVNSVVGKTYTVDELKDNYDAVFIGSGAGIPQFLGIKGENLNGVYSANEYLTRINLMQAYKEDSETPVLKGSKVVVVGAGNVAMDAARTALRMNAEKVILVYRRSREEMPARAAEIEHAEQEDVEFNLLTNPVEILGENGKVTGIKCIKMELGEPDASGRRRPVPIENSEFVIDCDEVIVALGTKPNHIIKDSCDELKTTSNGSIVIDAETELTSIDNVYAGGDAVTGAATVILAMGAGKQAAKKISEKN